jgi:hypothetical protein
MASLAGCSGSSDVESDDDVSVADLHKDAPEEPVKGDVQFSKSSTEADVRVVVDIVSIPSDGEFGSLDLALDVNKNTNQFADYDTLLHIESTGFNEPETGVWNWDGDHDTPSLTLDIQISDDWIANFGTDDGTVLASYYWHVDGFVDAFSARYYATHPDNSSIEEMIPIKSQFEITLQEPSFTDWGGEGGFVLFGPHEYVRLINNNFEFYIVGRRDSLPSDAISLAKKINEARHTLQLGGHIDRAYGWVLAIDDVLGRAFETQDGVGRFTSNVPSILVWLHEYVHLEQQFELNSDMKWFLEASAGYFSSLFALYDGLLEFNEFYSRQSDFSTDQPLSNLDSPMHQSAYAAESLLAALDAKIREESGDTTLASVFRSMNDHRTSIDIDVFSNMVRDAAGQSLDQWLERNVTQSAQTTIPRNEELFVDRDRFNIVDSENITYESVNRHVKTE